jgi:hypothetical protein
MTATLLPIMLKPLYSLSRLNKTGLFWMLRNSMAYPKLLPSFSLLDFPPNPIFTAWNPF